MFTLLNEEGSIFETKSGEGNLISLRKKEITAIVQSIKPRTYTTVEEDYCILILKNGQHLRINLAYEMAKFFIFNARYKKAGVE